MVDPDPYITASGVRALVDGLTPADDPKIVAAVAEFEPLAERYLGVAFRARTATYTGRARNGTLELPHVMVSAVDSLTYGGTAVTRQTDDLDSEAGRLSFLYGSHSPYVTGYTHGFTEPTPGVLAACVEYVASRVKSQTSGQSRNVLTQSMGDGTMTRYSTPDWDAGRPTGFLQVDALLNAEVNYRIRVY